MMNLLFIISDLHLGGAPATKGKPSFQMCGLIGQKRLAAFIRYAAAQKTETQKVELLINGDFVDFLAEEPFTPFTDSDEEATRKLANIMKNNSEVFDALHEFVVSGNRLTIALGNHDIELSLPGPRSALLDRLGSGPVELVYDNQAIVRGPVLVEHGNRYDGWNVVEHNLLREVRSRISRKETPPEFTPPAGSELVANVMNKIKKEYPFIDLLKPENEGALPILAVFVPKYFKKLKLIADTYMARSKSKRVEFDQVCVPENAGYISAIEMTDAPSVTEMEHSTWIDSGMAATVPLDGTGVVTSSNVDDVKQTVIELQHAAELAGETVVGSPEIGATDKVHEILGFLQTFAGAGQDQKIEKTKHLHRALRRFTRVSADFLKTNVEQEQYLISARKAFTRGHRVVVYGHTHLLKRQDLNDGTYINTGTWADLLLIPEKALSANEEDAFPELYEFADDLVDNNLDGRRGLIPSYARIEYERDTLNFLELMIFHSDKQQDVVTASDMKDLHVKHASIRH